MPRESVFTLRTSSSAPLPEKYTTTGPAKIRRIASLAKVDATHPRNFLTIQIQAYDEPPLYTKPSIAVSTAVNSSNITATTNNSSYYNSATAMNTTTANPSNTYVQQPQQPQQQRQQHSQQLKHQSRHHPANQYHYGDSHTGSGGYNLRGASPSTIRRGAKVSSTTQDICERPRQKRNVLYGQSTISSSTRTTNTTSSTLTSVSSGLQHYRRSTSRGRLGSPTPICPPLANLRQRFVQ
jgi:hypothetical protein